MEIDDVLNALRSIYIKRYMFDAITFEEFLARIDVLNEVFDGVNGDSLKDEYGDDFYEPEC